MEGALHFETGTSNEVLKHHFSSVMGGGHHCWKFFHSESSFISIFAMYVPWVTIHCNACVLPVPQLDPQAVLRTVRGSEPRASPAGGVPRGKARTTLITALSKLLYTKHHYLAYIRLNNYTFTKKILLRLQSLVNELSFNRNCQCHHLLSSSIPCRE